MTLPVGFAGPNQLNGATEPVSAVDIRLDALSTPVQSVNMTITGLNVYLPNAAEKKTGGPVFIISATSASSTFTIRDFAGNAITTVAAGAAVILSLTNNISSAGSWSCKAFSSITQLIAGTATVGNAATTSAITVCPLSSQQAMIVYYDSVNFKAVVITVNGASVVFGVIFSFVAYFGTNVAAASMTGGAKVIAVYRNSTTTFLESIILTPSGTGSSATVIAGAALVINGVASSVPAVVALSASQAICVYNDTTGGRTATLNVSGTVVTNGTVATIVANAITAPAITMLTAIKAIVAYSDATAVAGRTVILDVSGTTVTPATIASFYTTTNTAYNSITTLSATKALCAFQGSSSYLYAVILDVVTSTITPATVLTVNGAASTYISVAALNSTMAACTYYETSLKAVTFSVSTSTITASTPLAVSTTAVSANYNSIALLPSTNKFVDSFAGASSFLNAETIEYTVSV